jgi:flagellar hook-associated protein 2
MAVNLTGMASGLDTDSIITQLMAVDQNKITLVGNRQTGVQAHQDDLKAIATKLTALQTAAAALGNATTWTASQSTSSSDTSKVTATLLSGAGIGGHAIQVDKLASSAQHGFAFTPSATDGQLNLYYGTDSTAAGASKVTIDVPPNATASDVATSINANENAPVYAAVITDNSGQSRLVLSARKTGASSDFTVDGSGLADPAQVTEDSAYARTGTTLNAQYKLDDETTDRTSESNIVDNAVPGLRLTLNGVSTSPVSVTTAAAAVDQTSVTSKVQAFVDAYNAVVDLASTDVADKRVVTPATTADLQAGQLFGDSGVGSMLTQLKSAMTQAVSGLGLNGLAAIGITIPKSTGTTPSADALTGKLSFDSSVLTTAMNTDYTQVRSLFQGSGTTKGFSSLISDYVDAQTGTNGVFTGRISSDDTSIKSYTDQVTDLTTRMNDQQTRLRAQFAAMETALSQSQTQQAWLTSQISTLPAAA